MSGVSGVSGGRAVGRVSGISGSLARRRGRGGAAALAAALGLGLSLAPAGAGAADEERLRKIEDELRAVKEELAGVRQESAVSNAKVAEMEEEVGALEGLLQRVKVGGYGSLRYDQSSLGEEEGTFTFRRLVFTTDAQIAPKLRFFSELEYERFRKLELERSSAVSGGELEIEQAVEGTNASEIALEQAWLEYAIDDAFKIRTGGVMVPLGRFNINHDDNQWNLPRRSLVDRGVPVLPSKAAWSELGAGFTGDLMLGESTIDYRFYVVNGVALEPEVETELISEPGEGILEGIAEFEPQTGTFSKDVKEAKAFTGRVAWEPAPGHEIAASFYTGRYTPDFLPDRDVTSFALDGITRFLGFELEGQVASTHWSGLDSVVSGFADAAINDTAESTTTGGAGTNAPFKGEAKFEIGGLQKRATGYWLELRKPFWPGFLPRGEFRNPQLIPTLRMEQVWFDDRVTEATFSGGSLDTFEKEDRRLNRGTFGLAYRPTPLVVFTAAYEYTWADDDSLSGLTNFLSARGDEDAAHALLLGASFGF